MLQNNTTRHQPEDNPDGKSLNVQIFEHNHRKITDCMLNFIKQGVEPTQDDIARETGLSRKCVNEHFNNFDPKKERKKTLLMMEMLKPKIDMRISAQALNGDYKFIKLFNDITRTKKKKLKASHNFIDTQNNSIHIDLNIEKLQTLSPEMRTNFVNALKLLNTGNHNLTLLP